MSISEFFNRKARIAVAATAFGLAGAGGYVGHEMAQNATQPTPSTYTFAQLTSIDEDAVPQDVMDQIERQQYFPAELPAGLQPSAETIVAQQRAVTSFTQRIDAMEFAKARVGDASSQSMVQEMAVNFVNDLRLSENLSERDYTNLLRDYDARVGIDVSAITGNYADGVMYQQEASLAVYFAQAFGGFFDDDEDMTDQQMSREIGDAMQKGQSYYDNAGMAGGLAGGAVGFMLMVPMWMRLRRAHPKLK